MTPGSGCFAMAQTDRQTNRRTWRLYDWIGPDIAVWAQEAAIFLFKQQYGWSCARNSHIPVQIIIRLYLCKEQQYSCPNSITAWSLQGTAIFLLKKEIWLFLSKEQKYTFYNSKVANGANKVWGFFWLWENLTAQITTNQKVITYIPKTNKQKFISIHWCRGIVFKEHLSV